MFACTTIDHNGAADQVLVGQREYEHISDLNDAASWQDSTTLHENNYGCHRWNCEN